MPVTKNIEVVMLLLFQIFAIGQQKLMLFALKFLFAFHVADAAFARPEVCNAHANVRVNPSKQPLAKPAVEEPLENFIGRVTGAETIAMTD